MANRSNETSRQRRARENRARRAALEARKKRAQTPREERQKATSSPSKASGSATATKREQRADARASSGSARQAMAQGRLGQVPVDVESLEGSFLGRVVHVPGGMQVVMAAVLVVVLSVMGALMDTIPEEGADAGATATRTLFEVYGAGALLFLAPPLILVGNALFFSLHAKRRRMWTISAIMLAIFSALMVQFVFPAAFLAYAAWRSKRVEDGPRRPAVADDRSESDADADAETPPGTDADDPS